MGQGHEVTMVVNPDWGSMPLLQVATAAHSGVPAAKKELARRRGADLSVERVNVVDLSEAWRTEHRDRHGEWTRGAAAAKRLVHKIETKHVEHELTTENAHSIRTFRMATTQTRIKMLEDSGLTPKFKDRSEEQLLLMATHPSASVRHKSEIREEVERRIAALQTYAVALDQSITDERRKEETGWFKRWDAKLASLPGGKHIISLRDKILSDGVLDRLDKVRENIHENGKEYAVEVATGLAMMFAFHPLGEAIAGVLGHEAGKAAFEHLTENILVESAIIVTLSRLVGKVVGPVFHPLSREAKIERAKKVLAKQEAAAEAAMKLDREQRLRLSGHKLKQA
jgi:hypothetical protein